MTHEKEKMQFSKIQEVRESSEESILELANVVGIGIGYKEVRGEASTETCISVYVQKKIAVKDLKSCDQVPKALGDVKTDVVEVGLIETQAFTSRVRPVKPGYSIGHYRVTAGTFGCLVREICPPCRVFILSNNHVLANSNAAKIGDPILQPGTHDGGSLPGDVIARLSRFQRIRFNDSKNFNLVDAAIARPRGRRNVVASIAGLGIPKGTIEATLGMAVIKSGRTTETTVGKVTGVDATIAVNFGSPGVAYFRDQILTTNMSQGGDSGSLLLSGQTNEATGLLFAGSSSITVHNNISNVLMALDVEIVTA
ncbi:FIG00497627: hypothetical protein [hydrothermal vent metagenome]|uniref:Serine protease n=1 Tax=hydrothermal vent metagenome TaxID=652676 RepID=A0A3B1A803_9ZZZZ